MEKNQQYIDGLTGVNDKYREKGRLGSYRTSDTQFPNPSGVEVFEGFGANKEDLVRGFCTPQLRELPEYDRQNYFYRYSEPKSDDLAADGPGLSADYEFRNKERVSKGFLTRPRIPTER